MASIPSIALRNQKIVDMWRENQTSTEIANELGMTRSAVMGVVHRSGERKTLAKGKTSSLPVHPSPAPKPILALAPQPVSAPAPKPILEKEIVLKKEGKNIMDLGPFDCRWVFNDGSFCCEKKANRSYCTDHAKIVYVLPYKKGAPRQRPTLARQLA